MLKKTLLALGLLLFGGCLLPHYDLEPTDQAQGGSSAAGAAGATGPAATAGSTHTGGANGTAGKGGTGGAAMSGGSNGTAGGGAGTAGSGQLEVCATGEKTCDGKCVAIDNVEYGCGAASCNKTDCQFREPQL